MSFVRKKRINGKEYYYLVRSIRDSKRIERYIGLNPPTKKEIEYFDNEFDKTKIFLKLNQEKLEKIRSDYQKTIKTATKDQLKKIQEDIFTRLTYNTSKIEGSSLTLNDTNLLLNQGITPNNKSTRDVKEVENHKKALLFIKDYKKDIDLNLILTLHNILKQDVSEDAGMFRNAGVRVGNMIGLNHKLIATEIKNLLSWYDKNRKKIHILELISQFHCTFERIHPFFDGNGRVGRLLMNHTLNKDNYPIIIIQDKNKKRYYNALIKGQRGNYLFMVKYLLAEMENESRNLR